jgi:hypothetical protein
VIGPGRGSNGKGELARISKSQRRKIQNKSIFGGVGSAVLRGRSSFADHSSQDLMLIAKGSIGVGLSKDGVAMGWRVSGRE